MKAAILEATGQPLVLRSDVEIADPGPGYVRVKIAHCGVCHSDLSIVDGAIPAPLPIILGHEAAGVVDEVGPGVSGLAPGDKVVLSPCPPCGTCYWCVRAEPQLCVSTMGMMTNTFTDGTTGLSRGGETVYRGVNVAAFSEYVVIQESGAVKIPADVPLDIACVVGCAVQTGVGAVLNTAQVEEGATVLIMGLGGIGLSTVQGARLAGARRIIVSDPVSERREMAKRLGATDLLDPTSDDVVARAREITEVGVDYAFETAGVADLVVAGFNAARNGGTIVMVGAPPIDQSITVAPASLFTVSEKKLVGCLLGSCNSLHDIPRMIGLWQAGRIDLEALITSHRPIEEINEAMDDLRASRGVRTVLDL
ncbi:MAG: Zn-dependent alcohol dehydrogenase [Deltaproteobacteria bacterium]|nr:Zn-dependent alcohol dehydrogenase [Deltaproteobacteria bacterium]